jgi:hypothetical protein
MLASIGSGTPLSGEEMRSLRLAVSRSAHHPDIPTAHERKLRDLGLVRETGTGLSPTDKGWMALGHRGMASA